jgi:hypothetical protein
MAATYEAARQRSSARAFALISNARFRKGAAVDICALELVSDFFSGPIKISWQKLQNYYFDEREEHQRETIGEWFQWLAERLAEREETTPRIAAHIAHKNWVQRK